MFKNESNLDSRLPFIIMMSYLKKNANGITSFIIYKKKVLTVIPVALPIKKC